jgi:hypothetical protein
MMSGNFEPKLVTMAVSGPVNSTTPSCAQRFQPDPPCAEQRPELVRDEATWLHPEAASLHLPTEFRDFLPFWMDV